MEDNLKVLRDKIEALIVDLDADEKAELNKPNADFTELVSITSKINAYRTVINLLYEL